MSNTQEMRRPPKVRPKNLTFGGRLICGYCKKLLQSSKQKKDLEGCFLFMNMLE